MCLYPDKCIKVLKKKVFLFVSRAGKFPKYVDQEVIALVNAMQCTKELFSSGIIDV